MLPVSTLLAISHVLVRLDMKEMESCVQVCSLLVIYMNINNKIKGKIGNFKYNINSIL